MRKNVWKRCLAMFLSATMFFASVKVTLADTVETKSLGEIVAEYYKDAGKITSDELTILTDADLKVNETKYDFTAPAETLETKVTLDVATKTIRAENYEAAGIKWSPMKAMVIYSDGTEDEEASGAGGVFTYEGEGTVKEVKVTYQSSIEMTASAQVELLNTSRYIYDGTETVLFVVDDPVIAEYAKKIQSATTYLNAALGAFDTVKADPIVSQMVALGEITLPSDDAVAEVDGYVSTLESRFELGDCVDAYESSTNDALYWAANASVVMNSIVGTYDAISALSVCQTLADIGSLLQKVGNSVSNSDATNLGGKIINDYIPTFKNYVADEVIQEVKEDTASFYADKTGLIVENPVDGITLPRRSSNIGDYDVNDIITTSFPVTTTDITVQASNRIITVNVVATVIGENNAEITLDEKSDSFVVSVGTDYAKVKAEAAEKVGAMISEIEASGAYNLDKFNNSDVYDPMYYDCLVTSDMGSTVESNADINVTYTPKKYSVTCTEEGADVELVAGNQAPYGWVIDFPDAAEDGMSYEYAVVGTANEVYEQTEAYVVRGEVSFTRTIDKAKEPKKVNAIAAEDYKDQLNDTAEKILLSSALDSVGISARVPEDGLVTLASSTVVNVPEYVGGNQLIWKPVKVAGKLNSGTLVETVTADKISNAQAVLTNTQYDYVEVEYALAIDGVDASEIVNTPYTLSMQVKKQLSDLNVLASYSDGLSQINRSILEMLSTQLNKASQDAIEEVIAENCNPDENSNGELLLYNYVLAYKNSSNAGKIEYYYAHYNEIKEQINELADQLAIIAQDEGLEKLKDNPTFADKAEYIDKISEYADKLGEMKTTYFDAKSDKILVGASGYSDLLEDLVSGKANQVTVVDGLNWTQTLTVTALTKASVSITVVLKDGSDKTVSSKTADPVTFEIENGLSEQEYAQIASKYSALLSDMNIDTTHYNEVISYKDNVKPAVGMKVNAAVTYTWSPKKYTVKLEGETGEYATQTFPYDSQRIILPSAPEGYKYIYSINGKDVEQTGSYYYSLKDDFKALFDDANVTEITIKRTTINEAAEKMSGFIADTNAAFAGAGMKDDKGNLTMAMIPYTEDGETASSVVLRITDNGNIKGMANGLMAMMQQMLTTYSNIELGGKPVKNGSEVTLQGVIDALLVSEISTASLAQMFDTKGAIVNNTNPGNGLEPLNYAGNARRSNTYMIPNMDELGAEVIETTLKLDGNSIPLFISYQDFDQTSEEKANRKDIKKALEAVDAVAAVKLTGGEVTVTFKEPVSQEAYEVYLLAMILEGNTTLGTVNDVTFKDIVDYEYGRFTSVVKENTDVTVQTFENTLNKLGVTADLESNETIKSVIENVLKLIRQDGDNSLFTIDKDNESVAENEYRILGTADKDELLKRAGEKIEGFKDFIADENYKVPVKIIVDCLADDYAALVINDLAVLKQVQGADKETILKIAKNALTLVTAEELDKVAKTDNAIVIMLGDAEDKTLTFKNKGLLDLNGFKLGSVKAPNGIVIVTDSTYGNNGKLDNASGNIKDVRANNFYSIAGNDKDGYVFTLDAGFLASAATVTKTELKPLAVEMVLDLLMNNITSGRMVISGDNFTDNQLYAVNFNDVFALMEKGAGNAVNELLDSIQYNGADKAAGLTLLVNDVIDTLTDFTALQKAVNEGTTIRTYTLSTYPLKVEADVAGEGNANYITLNLTTSETAKTITMNFVVGGDADEKKALAELCGKFAEIVKKADIEVGLSDIDYKNGGIAVSGAFAKADIEIDMSGDINYPLVFAMVVAYGSDDADLKAAVKAYLADTNPKVRARVYLANAERNQEILKDAVDSITTAQLIAAVKAVNGKTFAEVLEGLGMNVDDVADAQALEKVYHDFLSVAYRVASLVTDYFGITGGRQTLGGVEDSYGVYGGSHVGTHKGVSVNAILSLKLFVQDQPGGDTPGGDEPGGDTPGGDTPGGDTPGGDEPGGDTPGGDQPGGDTPGGNEPGGDTPGGDQPGGNEPGGDDPSDDNDDEVIQPGKPVPTGDTSNVWLWISMIAVALGTIIVLRNRFRKIK